MFRRNLQLEHFLHSYQLAPNLNFLGVEYDPSIIHEIRTDRIAYIPILEEAAALLLSEEESLVTCFIGFLRRQFYLCYSSQNETKLDGLPNYAHKSIHFPTIDIFIDAIAHAHHSLSRDKITDIARALVSTCETNVELSNLIADVKRGLVVDANECPEPINPLNEVDFLLHEVLERKTRGEELATLSTWFVAVMEDEAQGMDLKVVEPEYPGNQDDYSDDEEDDQNYPNGQGQSVDGYGGGWA